MAWIRFCLLTALAGYGILCTSAQARQTLWKRDTTLDNKVVTGKSTRVYDSVATASRCACLCTADAACRVWFYRKSSASCVTCPEPCNVTLVASSGYHFYMKQYHERCPSDYHFDQATLSCFKLDWTARSFNDSSNFCALSGGHLVYMKTRDKWTAVQNFLQSNACLNTCARVWFGASDAKTEGTWLWLDGTNANSVLSGLWYGGAANEVNEDEDGLLLYGSHFADSPLSYTFKCVCEIDVM